MTRVARWLGVAVAVVAALAIAATAGLRYLVDTPRAQSFIASQASQVLGRSVTFTSVGVRLFPWPAVALQDLKVAEDPRFGAAPFLVLERGDLRLKLAPLLRGRLEFGAVVLGRPVVTVVQDAQGRWNFASLGTAPGEVRAPVGHPRGGGGGGGTITLPPVLDVRLEKGVVIVSRRGRGRLARTYRLEDVDLRLETRPTGIALRGSSRLAPGDLRMTLADGLVTLAGGKPLNEAALAGKLIVDGKNVADLAASVLGGEPVVTGEVKGALALGGHVGNPRASGNLAVSNLSVSRTDPQCPAPQRRTLTVPRVTANVIWEDAQLTARPLQVALEAGTLTTNAVAILDRGVHVQARDLAVAGVRVEKLLVDFLCQGYAVTGPLDLNGVLSFDGADIRGTLAGSGRFRIGSGHVVGPQALALIGDLARVGGAVSSVLAKEIPSAPGASPLEFNAITGTFDVARGVVTTRDLVYASRAMRVAVAGEYVLASARMDLGLTVQHGRSELQARVSGPAASPSIRMDPAAALGGAERAKVQSALEELLRKFR